MSRVFLLMVLMSWLAGCGGALDKRYLEASLAEDLVIPPDLTDVERESRFDLPASFSGDDPTDRTHVPVLAKVDSLQLESQSGLYWLSVAEPVDNLYQLVKNFWAAEGYRLVDDEPVIGVMRTEWVYQEEGNKNKAKSESWWQSLIAGEDLSASQNQFKTRIERDERRNLNRVYIIHRGTEYKHVVDSSREDFNDEDLDWQFRLNEPELEIEMLSRLMVYLGLEQSQVDSQVANPKLFKPRATFHFDIDENSPYLLLNDPYHVAWNRVYHQLERLNFEIAAKEFTSIVTEGYFIVDTDFANNEDDSGGFFSFGSRESEKRQMVLVLSEETHEFTRVEIENREGELEQSEEGRAFLKLIYQQIK